MRELAVKEESLLQGQAFHRAYLLVRMVGGNRAAGSGPGKNNGLRSRDRRPFGITWPECQPPSVSSVSFTLLRMQVKIGVSRNV